MQAEHDIPTVPENGWQIEDFPAITLTPVAYTTNPGLRPDPAMAISPQGWMTVDIGGTRIGFPSREEWEKFIDMGNRMYNSHQIQQQREAFEKMERAAAAEPTSPPEVPEE